MYSGKTYPQLNLSKINGSTFGLVKLKESPAQK
nr:MAG TPA: hypothetical protein [Caudoviricetes sp.]